ncbi:MAG: YbhB/YbcL family Raf kinase inhibitor-like protein [Deltaproteobacteria bacterium]|nr:YbhB/YbcL family Raf kinase inhibitor-like protein [Deltaproteobacteria bacterium]
MKRLSLLAPLALAACAHSTAPCPTDTTARSAAAAATADSVAYVPTGAGGSPAPSTLRVTSEAFAEGTTIPIHSIFNGFGCTGENRSPAIQWSGTPEGTRSFAVIVHDPDAPTGTGFYHWVAYDLPGDTRSLPDNAGAEGSLPAGAHVGRTDYGTGAYGGPCPPPGPAHRYRFSVYALDTPALGAPEGSSAALVRFMLRGHVLAHGTLTGTYGR